MRRLGGMDRVLLAGLLPVWLGFASLSIVFGLDGGQPVFSALARTAPGADAYPTVWELGSWTERGVMPEVRIGDEIRSVGGVDMRGRTAGGVIVQALDAIKRTGSAEVVFARRDAVHTVLLISERKRDWWTPLPFSVACIVTVVLVLLRRPDWALARRLFLAGVTAAIGFLHYFGPYPWSAWSVALSLVVVIPISLALALSVAIDLPEPRPRSAWTRALPWALAIVYGGQFAMVIWWAHPFSLRGYLALRAGLVAVWATALIAALVAGYRAADPLGRRQLRWVIYGFSLGVLAMTAAFVLHAVGIPPAALRLAYAAGSIGMAAIPLGILVAVIWFDFLDVDRLISATASYNILAVLLGGGALVAVPRMAEAASRLAGIDPRVGQVVLSLALVALVIPAHQRLRPQIDRVFFKERYALDHGIAELLPTLSACTDARELTERAGAGLQRLLRPEVCVVYAGVEESYAPVFAKGRAVPPAFEPDSLLIGALRGRRAPLSLGDAGRRPDDAPLGPFDRAALETLQAEVVVPVRQDDALAAFVCLGPKRSGDVYTSTDLSLLAAVAETVSLQLQRFDQDSVIREGREMQESLRRYVPGAVAEQLASGAELASGEREVSVLFVDIRGYTGFAESRKAEEIFSTVNRYTEAVSQIVQRHSGSVVEFNGDGMMAVFGAPRELAHKERAVVEAGRAIAEAVGKLPVPDASGGGTKLAVGVGIATGEAFVGNIQAVDRMIWSAIGNTTNLAARLQSLTRELDASVVIDATTRERAQSAADDFEKRAYVAIRGRRETQDVYALPLPSAG